MGVAAGEFLRTTVVPVVLALLPLAAVAGLVVALPLSDWATVVVGGLAGGAGLRRRRSRVALDPGELRKLEQTVLGRRETKE